MLYFILKADDTYLNNKGGWTPNLTEAKAFPAEAAVAIVRFLGNCVAIRPRALHQLRHSEHGYVLLMELLVVTVILLTVAAIAVPNLFRIKQIQQQTAAHDRVLVVARAKANINLCASDPTCVPNPAAAALVPTPGTVYTEEGYVYSESLDGTTFTALPINAQIGLVAYAIGTNNILQCGGSPCP